MQIIKRITKLAFLHRLQDGERLPRWYGLAWFDMAEQTYVVAPIPLNLLLGLWNKAYYWLRYPITQPVIQSLEIDLGFERKWKEKAEKKLAAAEKKQEKFEKTADDLVAKTRRGRLVSYKLTDAEFLDSLRERGKLKAVYTRHDGRVVLERSSSEGMTDAFATFAEAVQWLREQVDG